MKKISLLTLLIITFSTISFAQIGIGTTTPNAQLDITSTTQGLLIPRVDLTSLNIQAPVINPKGGSLAVSTIVFHNGTNGITAGYYYWDGTKWQGIGKADENRGLQFYAFTGNGVSPNVDKSNFSLSLVNSGLWSGSLNDACRNTIRTGDNYTIMFTGTLVVETPGNFQLQSTSDDGSRVVIDGIPVLNRWIDQGPTAFNSSTIYLAKGRHKIEFWYYENTGSEFMQFNWLQNANGTTGIVSANSFVIE
ncbi:MAG TPA: PA14 domain-containing protein [Flavobacterium sp.]|uniref:PA14 domain-containing protein n=1 Tax=Flavobacterium sp. TaxID=239 RepID=UPI002B4B92D7|nr:PA14 domain-containing protein [Flavobacterium sp.]HLO72578.1 PA14 domain-containing protein [Flavobacterium sp.]